MCYKIIRIDGEEDKITSNNFINYSDAYDFLEEIYGDLCCSDIDYEELIYYDIIKIISK
tara:strand:- start:259 stop:435 length:177 start_codon:yes stop_codon:yes gene_type:complete